MTKSIAFVCGSAGDKTIWNPDAMSDVRGSERQLVAIARLLAASGIDVRVYCPSCGPEKSYDGVRYIPHLPASTSDPCDVVVAFRDATYLTLPLAAKRRFAWCHDVHIWHAEHLHLADLVLVNSQVHKAVLLEHHRGKVDPDRIVVIGAGIDASAFAGTVQRDPKRYVWTSSPDRGLLQFLTLIWPAIVARVPDASLGIYYGFPGWTTDVLREHEVAIRAAVGKSTNVTLRGAVSRDAYARELLASAVWVYSPFGRDGSAFFETGCVASMEAQACGLFPVCGAWGALLETCFAFGRLVMPGDKFHENFVNIAIEALNDPRPRAAVQQFAREMFSIEGAAVRWRALLGA